MAFIDQSPSDAGLALTPADVVAMAGVDPAAMSADVGFSQAFASCEGRIVAVWAGGSRLHGLAGPDSDVDLHVLVVPGRDNVLLGDSGTVFSRHDPDIVVETLPHWLHGIVSGSPLTLESLTARGGCLFADDGTLAAVARLARDLAGAGTAAIALRMARAIMARRLRHTVRMPLTPGQGKLLAEAYRLADGAVALANDGGPWPGPTREPARTFCRTLREERRVAGGTDDPDRTIAFVAGFIDNAERMVRIDHAGLDGDGHHQAREAAIEAATTIVRGRILASLACDR